LQNASNLNIGNIGIGLPAINSQFGGSTTTLNTNINTSGSNLFGNSGLTSTFGSSGLQSNTTSTVPLSTQTTRI
jgi:hypothetical protein